MTAGECAVDVSPSQVFQQRLPFSVATPSRCSSVLKNKQTKPQEIFRVNRPRQITEPQTRRDSAAMRILTCKIIWPYFERFWALRLKVLGTCFVSLGYSTLGYNRETNLKTFRYKVSLRCRKALGMQWVKVVGVKIRAGLKVDVPKYEGSGSSVSPSLVGIGILHA